MHKSLSGQELKGNRHLDPRISKSFSKPTSDKHEGGVVELFETDGFIVFNDIGFVKIEVDPVGFSDLVVFVRID